VQHLERQHGSEWSAYKQVLQKECADAMEKFLNDEEVGFVNTMRAHIYTGVRVRFFFDKNIVRDVIGGMLFEPDTSDAKSEAALAVFQTFVMNRTWLSAVPTALP
jgi:hypothetical protein